MMYKKTIAIEGISGIGKSNLGQHLSLLYNELGIKNRWYFELEDKNPVIPKQHNINIIKESFKLWDEYINSNKENQSVDIFDGRMFMLNIDFSMRNGLNKDEIIFLMEDMIDLINKNEIQMILLYTSNIEALYENTIKERECSSWYIQNLQESNYLEDNQKVDENTVIKFMQELQDIMKILFKKINTRKKLLDITNLDWSSSYNKLDVFLGSTNLIKSNSNTIFTEYLGQFENKLNKEKYKVEIQDSNLVCSDHPYKRYKPVEQILKLKEIESDVFVAKGHPIKLKYTRNNEGVINGLIELGLFNDENFQGIKKEPFLKINI